ncbi:MAG: hypothetical protein HOM52_06090 [Rhodospirillaceae bacterium]|nr:hypothetical protein [Rhodospirillaceae bacterium]MBT5038061.1 hypothetical protein [Rhodospirillaceae bacterium]
MCTLVILRRPGHDWPILVAANRDEMFERDWSGPARHWPDRADIVAGRDNLAGGSWLGVNDSGVIAGILNRMGSLGPSEDKRSRGELVLEALDHGDAADAAEALMALNGDAYRPFNLVVADNSDAFWLRHDGAGPIGCQAIPPGFSMFTARERNDAESARVQNHLPRFEQAAVPDPNDGDWGEWEKLLASKEFSENSNSHEGAMCVKTIFGFGTVNASLIALAAPEAAARRPLWRFSAGPPDENSFVNIDI